MKRDLDLVRIILLAVEASPAGIMLRNREIEAPGFDPAVVSEHVQLLTEADFLKATISREINPSGARECHIFGLTWQGHEYLDAVRNQEVWTKTKQSLAKVGGSAALEVVKQIASAIIKQHLGLPG
jgi:hypothetical protein